MKIFIAGLGLLLLLGGNTTAENQMIVTQVKGYPAVGDTSDSSPVVLSIFAGADFAKLRPDIDSIVTLMGEDNHWVDVGPDSSYVSVALTLGDRHFTIDSWYPLFIDMDTTALLDGSLIRVATREEKVKRESQNSDKYKALYSFLDRIMENRKAPAPSAAGERSETAPSADP